MADLSPLKQEDCDKLNLVLKNCNSTREYLEKCKRCGLPVDELIATNEQQKQLSERIKAEFFPNNP